MGKQSSVRMVRMNEKGQIITSEGKTDLTKQNWIIKKRITKQRCKKHWLTEGRKRWLEMKEAKVGMKEMREITEFTVCNNTRWGIFTNKSGRDSVRWSLMFYLA